MKSRQLHPMLSVAGDSVVGDRRGERAAAPDPPWRGRSFPAEPCFTTNGRSPAQHTNPTATRALGSRCDGLGSKRPGAAHQPLPASPFRREEPVLPCRPDNARTANCGSPAATSLKTIWTVITNPVGRMRRESHLLP